MACPCGGDPEPTPRGEGEGGGGAASPLSCNTLAIKYGTTCVIVARREVIIVASGTPGVPGK